MPAYTSRVYDRGKSGVGERVVVDTRQAGTGRRESLPDLTLGEMVPLSRDEQTRARIPDRRSLSHQVDLGPSGSA